MPAASPGLYVHGGYEQEGRKHVGAACTFLALHSRVQPHWCSGLQPPQRPCQLAVTVEAPKGPHLGPAIQHLGPAIQAGPEGLAHIGISQGALPRPPQH